MSTFRFLPAALAGAAVGLLEIAVPAEYGLILRPPIGGLAVFVTSIALFPLANEQPRRPPYLLSDYLIPDGKTLLFRRYAMLCACIGLMSAILYGWMLSVGRSH